MKKVPWDDIETQIKLTKMNEEGLKSFFNDHILVLSNGDYLVKRNSIQDVFKEFVDKLNSLGVVLDDHAEFFSLIRDKNTREVLYHVHQNEVEDLS